MWVVCRVLQGFEFKTAVAVTGAGASRAAVQQPHRSAGSRRRKPHIPSTAGWPGDCAARDAFRTPEQMLARNDIHYAYRGVHVRLDLDVHLSRDI